MNLIDTNANVSRWPFRRTPCDEWDALLKRLEIAGVTEAWVGSLDGIFHRDVGSVNERLARICDQFPRMLIPFGTVNPTLPDWEEELRRCHERYKMPGIRLHPNFHGYRIDDPRLKKLLELASERELIVQLAVRLDDTRVQHHLMQVADVDVTGLAPLVESVPNVKFMLINALRVVQGAMLNALVASGNVHVEISMLEGLGCVDKLIKNVPLSRIHFGSHLPLFNIESSILKLRESELSDTQRTAIANGNSRMLRPHR